MRDPADAPPSLTYQSGAPVPLKELGLEDDADAGDPGEHQEGVHGECEEEEAPADDPCVDTQEDEEQAPPAKKTKWSGKQWLGRGKGKGYGQKPQWPRWHGKGGQGWNYKGWNSYNNYKGWNSYNQNNWYQQGSGKGSKGSKQSKGKRHGKSDAEAAYSRGGYYVDGGFVDHNGVFREHLTCNQFVLM